MSRAECSTSLPTLAAVGEGELIVEIHRDDYVRYEGTAAQLVAEGLIPEGFKWPRAAASVRWVANGFEYWLRRTRPRGHKGPMRSWLEMDNWFVRVEVLGRDFNWRVRRNLQRQADELVAACLRHTAAGQLEWDAKWDLYRKVSGKPAAFFPADLSIRTMPSSKRNEE